jgi:antitoxin (DNA-binding transcriptional repressor) of toxin-antitoxin stability system
MSVDEGDEVSIGVTAFKARCLALIDDIAQGKARRILLTRHNRPVAAIVPVERESTELWGALRGTVRIPPGTDLTRSTREVWEADT